MQLFNREIRRNLLGTKEDRLKCCGCKIEKFYKNVKKKLNNTSIYK